MWAKVGVPYVKCGDTHRNLKFKGPALTLCTTRFNIKKLYVLPTKGVRVFCTDLGTNCDYFPVQHKLIVFITQTVYCAVRADL
jgi:hypothetical protein